MVGEDVEELVDTVLAEVPSGLRDACDRVGILAGLQTAGALSVPMLTNMLAEDYAEVKAAIGTAAKPAFVATLKAATTARPATPATPQQAAFQTPQARGQTAAERNTEPPPEAAVVTVKRGMVTLVTSRMIGLAASTTFAELLTLAVADQSEEQRTQLAGLPVKVPLQIGAGGQISRSNLTCSYARVKGLHNLPVGWKCVECH